MAQDSAIQRDENNRASSFVGNQEDRVSGPLGIWPFPILNFLLQFTNENNKAVVTEIHRDEDGRIQSIEEIKL